MSETTNDSAEQAVTAQELEILAKTDIEKFLGIFLSNFKPSDPYADEDDEDDEDEDDETNELEIDDVDEYREFDKAEQFLGLHIEEVDSEGGYEGAGDHAEVIFAVKKGEEILSHFRVTGYYSSYEGTEWSGEAELVEPRDVVVVQWFAKGE